MRWISKTKTEWGREIEGRGNNIFIWWQTFLPVLSLLIVILSVGLYRVHLYKCSQMSYCTFLNHIDLTMHSLFQQAVTFDHSLKWVFAQNERWYRLTPNWIRVWSLLILHLSVVPKNSYQERKTHILYILEWWWLLWKHRL